ncbi:hypothetical protein BRC81_10055 [Halobacteriales archaeon QS_1_68_20]|nr:MAG: hypothetical protein BRC81_10055 [Halobacteriales archaeon QS_1_68_20]
MTGDILVLHVDDEPAFAELQRTYLEDVFETAFTMETVTDPEEGRSFVDEETKADVDERIDDEIAAAIDRAKQAPETLDPDDLLRYAYADPPPEVRRRLGGGADD